MPAPPLQKLLQENPLVVTGLGAVSAGGRTVGDLWMAACAGRSLARRENFGAAGSFIVCRAPELDLTLPELRPVRKMDRCVQLALVAAHEAAAQAQLVGAYAPARLGIMLGSSRGPFSKRNESAEQFLGGKIPPTLSANSTFAALSGALGQVFQCQGPGATIAATCASSAFAIGLAAEQILLGKADAMLVGGTEAPLQAAILSQLQAAGVLAEHAEAAEAHRPFDVARNGLVLGEGSGFLVLESAATAAARGAKPLAKLSGWSFSLDNAGRTGVKPDGAELNAVMRQALALASISPDEVDYINAHGTGTKLNDAAEAQAVRALLGERATSVPCSSTKPITGHCLGATSALEAILAVQTLQHQFVPPTANCTTLDAACPIFPLALTGRPQRVTRVLSNSLGFWGYHAALVLTR